MKIKTVLKVVDGVIINNGSILSKIRKITIDTRKINKNDLFIAIKGNNFDGHDFIEEAIRKGVNAVIVEKDVLIETNIPIIKVNSTIEALGKLSKYNREKYRNIPIIAVTGSCGKTTTKELISLVLTQKYNVLKNEGSLNNHLGLPTTLLELNNKYDVAVLEMGMNHLNEISYLSNICLPDYGVITNIGTSHIGLLGNKKNIFKAKMEILDGMDNGYLIVNGMDKYLKRIKYDKTIKVLNNITNLKCDFEKTTFTLNIDNKDYDFAFNVPGKHLIIDVLIAIKVGIMFNVEIDKIIEAISKYKMIKGRVNIIKKDDLKIINDSYNSSFESLMGSLDLLNKNDYNIVVLGDILELGKHSYKIHKKIAKNIKKRPIDEILTIGTYTKVIKSNHFDNLDDLINYLNKIIKPNTTILIKGSAKMNLSKLVDYLVLP